MNTATASQRVGDDSVKARRGGILVWVAVILTVVVAACAARGPVVGGDPQSDVGGTISGIVRAAGGDSRLSARKVTAVNLVTGERIETSTATNGGYTMKVARGRYRLEVELRDGETLASAPDAVEIGRSDLDASRDFVITVRD